MDKHPSSQPTSIGIHNNWKASVVESMTPLSEAFSPGPCDLFSGGKAKTHQGNQIFQSIIGRLAEKYAKAKGKLGKSLIVSEIIDTIRQKSPNGGFVKQDGGKWYEVGDWTTKEKVRQSLHDILQGQYRFSSSSKKRRREESNVKMIEELDTLTESNSYVSKQIRCLSDTIETEGSQGSDLYLMLMMTKANSDILDKFKEDHLVQEKVKTVPQHPKRTSTKSQERSRVKNISIFHGLY
jgi:hypothetical protein